MTDVRHVQISCPTCGKPGEATVYGSVNVTLDPALREQIFSGELETYRCPECGAGANLVSSFLYHDMTNQIAVWYMPGAGPDEIAKAKKQATPSFLPMPQYFRDAPYVTSREELLQTITDREEQARVNPPGAPAMLPPSGDPPPKQRFLQRLFGRK